MEFHEKLQELRKNRGLTQEELAEALYVSRTAISKWESGRGYPSIDSLKEISKFFTVTIDDLLSGEKLLLIAEKENKTNIQSICEMLFGMVDLGSFLLIVLPLYPNIVNDYVYSVNLLQYAQTTTVNLIIDWLCFILLVGLGIIEVVLTKLKRRTYCKLVMEISIGISILTVLILTLTREVYATIIIFLLLVTKVVLLIKCIKTGR